MVRPTPFALDNWIREFKPKATAALHDTCVLPLSLKELASLAAAGTGNESDVAATLQFDASIAYGPTLGKPQLMQRILEMYQDSLKSAAANSPDKKLFCTVTSGCISANYLILDTLLGPGDHFVVQYPCYQQFFEIPRHAGAEVTLWKCNPEDHWKLQLSELDRIVKPNTKMIMLNSPNNPTGMTLTKDELAQIVEFAKARNIILLCDEIFRELFHPAFSHWQATNGDEKMSYGADFPSLLSFASQYENLIVTCSMSKTYALPGIRVGWVVSPNENLVHEVNLARDYTTIAVSQIDQDIAFFALGKSVRSKIVERSLQICNTNLTALEAFINKHSDKLEWTKPQHMGGSCAFVKLRNSKITDKQYCEEMIDKVGLLIVPGGWTFGNGDHPEGDAAEKDYVGYLRVGFVIDSHRFEHCLELWEKYLESS